MTQDDFFMHRAIQLARCGEASTAPNPMVGAVIVHNGSIIGEGYHRKYGGPHAEVNAIASVKDESLLKESTIYVTLEPCSHWGKTPPCCDLIISKHPRRVVVGMQDPNAKVNGQGLERIRQAGIEVNVGILEDECRRINPRFLTFYEKHRPYITLKWAQTNDKIIGIRAIGNEEKPETLKPRLMISTPFTQMLVHRLRARCQAIMVGTNTALNDNPTLTTRLWQGQSPLRVTIDRHNYLPNDMHLMEGESESLIYHNEILSEILFDLYKRGIQHLVVEGGSRLLQSFIDQNLWDAARVETAPNKYGKPETQEHRNLKTMEQVFAPVLKNATLDSEIAVDGNQIKYYSRKS